MLFEIDFRGLFECHNGFYNFKTQWMKSKFKWSICFNFEIIFLFDGALRLY